MDSATLKCNKKPPFRTRTETERRITPERLTKSQSAELWGSLHLQASKVAYLLALAHDPAVRDWIFPLVCTATHTGARRSELWRVLLVNLDMDGGLVLVREKKLIKGKRLPR